VVGRINKGTSVRIEERGAATLINRSAEWVRVRTATGTGGWLPLSELEAK
jgi:hypothetical protein